MLPWSARPWPLKWSRSNPPRRRSSCRTFCSVAWTAVAPNVVVRNCASACTSARSSDGSSYSGQTENTLPARACSCGCGGNGVNCQRTSPSWPRNRGACCRGPTGGLRWTSSHGMNGSSAMRNRLSRWSRFFHSTAWRSCGNSCSNRDEPRSWRSARYFAGLSELSNHSCWTSRNRLDDERVRVADRRRRPGDPLAHPRQPQLVAEPRLVVRLDLGDLQPRHVREHRRRRGRHLDLRAGQRLRAADHGVGVDGVRLQGDAAQQLAALARQDLQPAPARPRRRAPRTAAPTSRRPAEAAADRGRGRPGRRSCSG